MVAKQKNNHFSALKTFFLDPKRLFYPFFAFLRVLKSYSAPPHIGETTRLHTLLSHYPQFENFLESRYRITLTLADHERSFQAFCHHRAIGPARVVFMEFQLCERSPVRVVDGQAFRAFLNSNQPYILDVREAWEWNIAMLPGATPLNGAQFEKLIRTAPKKTPLAVYCHYGIRSLDAAVYLTDHGFENVVALGGGLEAWSNQVDPSFPKYHGHPC